MSTTRRTALAMLGLGSTAAIGAETFIEPNKYGSVQAVAGAATKERMATALENLAKELRAGNALAESIELNAKLTANDIADRHTLTLQFIYLPEGNVS